MSRIAIVDRRQALGWLGAIGAFTFGVRLAPRPAAAAAPTGQPTGDVGLFITLMEDGRTLLTSHRSEMGQHVLTALAQIMADEMEAAWDRVEVVQAIGHPRYGDQNTDGSRSVRRNFTRLREAGAAMRAMLTGAAVDRWSVPAAECVAEQHVVTHRPTGRTFEYGALAADAAARPVPEDVKLKSRAEWRYIGKSVPAVTIPDVVRGRGTFGIDVSLPGMLHAVIARPPRLFAALRSHDPKATLALPGVVRVVEMPSPKGAPTFQPFGGVAVVARDTWSAIRGREALVCEWTPGPNADYDSATFHDAMQATARAPGEVRRTRGDVKAALAAAATRVEAEYYVPHMAHCPMEPPAATAHWPAPDRLEVWACVQTPQRTREVLAGAFGIPPENVTVNVTWLGGGFGRKSKPDFVVEAAHVAKAAGAPVKVTWTREDELTHGYFHTVSYQRLEGGLDADGRCQAWLHRTVFPPIRSTFVDGASSPTWGDLRQGASDTPFAVPALQLESGEAKAHVRIGWLRSVANIYHAFAVQSFAAELAHAAGRDPKDYLLELIGPPRHVDPNTEGAEYDNYGDPLEDYPIDTGRLAATVRAVADLAEWGRARPKGHGLGIAAHRSFLSYVATVAEVAEDATTGRLRIEGVWSVMDAGTVVSIDSALNQLEGGTLFGLSNALYGEITAEKGRIVQRNLPQWRVMRMDEAPRTVEVRILESDAPPGGVGEPPTPPAAPALANAIHAATGRRIRRLPIFGPDNPNLLSRRPADAPR